MLATTYPVTAGAYPGQWYWKPSSVRKDVNLDLAVPFCPVTLPIAPSET